MLNRNATSLSHYTLLSFELTTALAFKHFAEQKVDIAVIEVGLGGRLDCTNIITPILSIITNISLDHTQFLGNTLGAIAAEKAGIIKHRVPVVIGESVPETQIVFKAKAQKEDALMSLLKISLQCFLLALTPMVVSLIRLVSLAILWAN